MKTAILPLITAFCLLLAGCGARQDVPPALSSALEPPVSTPEIAPPEAAPSEPEADMEPSLPEAEPITPPEEATRISMPERDTGTAARGERISGLSESESPSRREAGLDEDYVSEAEREATRSFASQSQRETQSQPEQSAQSDPSAPELPGDESARARGRAAPSEPFAGSENSEIEAELLLLINGERAAVGLSALGLEDTMQFAASIRAQEALVSLSHTRPDSSAYHTVFDEAGFAYTGKFHGENLAVLRMSADVFDASAVAAALLDEWRRSAGHQQNLLSENFVQTGVGVYVVVDGDTVAVGAAQLFASL